MHTTQTAFSPYFPVAGWASILVLNEILRLCFATNGRSFLSMSMKRKLILETNITIDLVQPFNALLTEDSNPNLRFYFNANANCPSNWPAMHQSIANLVWFVYLITRLPLTMRFYCLTIPCGKNSENVWLNRSMKTRSRIFERATLTNTAKTPSTGW